MAKILIINSGKECGFAKGKLNDYLTEVAQGQLIKLNHLIKLTKVDAKYDPQQEVEKIMWADVIIYQQPTWWMSTPWILNKYIDDVFSAGTGTLYKDDGRTRKDLTKKYGSGGLCLNKRYMICSTWNAPLEAFDDPTQFFEGKGIDTVYFWLHKANQFLGMKPLPTFMCNDVIKNPEIEKDVERYKSLLAMI